MGISLKRWLIPINFVLTFKDYKRKNSLNELIELAVEERGILLKVMQQIFPEELLPHRTHLKSLHKDKIIPIIEKELHLKFNEHFVYLSDALYSASIGQVHQAQIKTGPQSITTVAIKIQYPNIKQSIQAQIKLLKMAIFSTKFSSMKKWKIPIESHLAQIEKRLNEELDYHHEVSNFLKAQSFNSFSQSNENFLSYYRQYCSSKIIIYPWIEGASLNFIKTHWSNQEVHLAVEILVKNYLSQIFVNGFFQGDTNFSNFLFQKDVDNNISIQVNWIDFGNWCSVTKDIQQSLFSIMIKTIRNEDIDYLGHFEKIGFDVDKLKYLKSSLPELVAILLEPFLIDRPYDLKNWNMEEKIHNLLGENKWWFRSSGNAFMLEFIKSFSGIIHIANFLNVQINWHKLFLVHAKSFNIIDINQEVSCLQKNFSHNNCLAKNLIIHIFKNNKEHVKVELPAISFLDLENIIPEEVKDKLMKNSLNLEKIKSSYLEKGLIPGDIFILETVETSQNILTKFHVYLV